MKCELCEDKLLEYLYGEVSAEDAAKMEAHLASSEECRHAYEGFKSVRETVATLDDEGPPLHMHTRIMAHAEDRQARLKGRPLWAWILRPALATAMVTAIAAGLYLYTLKLKVPSYRNEIPVQKEIGNKEQDSLRSARSITAQDRPAQQKRKDEGGPERPAERKPAQPLPAGPLDAAREGPPSALKETEQSPKSESSQSIAGNLVPPNEEQRSLGKVAESGHAHTEKKLLSAESRAPAATTSPTYAKGKVLSPVAEAMELANKGQCAQAVEIIKAYATANPKDTACGSAWMEIARCYLKEGKTEQARDMAQRAAKIPLYSKDAETFIASLPSPQE